MNNRALILILSCFVFISIEAQVPGYMGKRITIGYSTLLHPNAFSIIYNPDLKYSQPVFTHAFYLNAIVGKHRELSFAFRYSNRKVDNSYFLRYEDSVVPEFERFALFEYSLSIKRFSKARFAPVGIYAKWELFYLTGQINYNAYQARGYDQVTQDYRRISYSGGKMGFVGFGGAYSLGKQRIFADKFVVDYGFRPSFMFIRSLDQSTTYEEHLTSYSSGRLNGLPIMQVYAGIGFLAF